jgi:hypothetical protein
MVKIVDRVEAYSVGFVRPTFACMHTKGAFGKNLVLPFADFWMMG